MFDRLNLLTKSIGVKENLSLEIYSQSHWLTKFIGQALRKTSITNLSSVKFVKLTYLLSCYQRWSPRGRPWPRGHILMSLALASKVKSLALASKLEVPDNCPVLARLKDSSMFWVVKSLWRA